jgi:hypothetical protein
MRQILVIANETVEKDVHVVVDTAQRHEYVLEAA